MEQLKGLVPGAAGREKTQQYKGLLNPHSSSSLFVEVVAVFGNVPSVFPHQQSRVLLLSGSVSTKTSLQLDHNDGKCVTRTWPHRGVAF